MQILYKSVQESELSLNAKLTGRKFLNSLGEEAGILQ